MEELLNLEREAVLRNNYITKAVESGESDVQRFYSGANVFITGGSGFVGKNLIEKLIRCCNVNKVFLLLRPKKNKSLQERLDEIISNPVFDYLHKHKPEFVKNVLAIAGDVSQLELGLSEDDRIMITEQVNVIFHSAANVSFDGTIKSVTLINVRGTRELLRLAKCCKNLRSVVHVSTAFSHATRSRVNLPVKELFYDCPISYSTMIELAETVEETKLNEMAKILKQDWPNNYSFSKALAEQVVRSEGQDLPICIVRPAVVVSSYREPMPGWIDPNNVFGASGVVLGTIVGVIHVLRATTDVKLCAVPADVVTNVTVVAGRETTIQQSNYDKIRIYNVVNNRNAFDWEYYIKFMNTFGREAISSQAVWYCFAIVTSSKFLYVIYFWLLHYVPGFFVDIALRVMGKPPMFLKIYKKISKLHSVLDFFINSDFQFQDDNTLRLHNSMGKTDRDIFNCDMATVNNEQLLKAWTTGVRKYIIKDETLDSTNIKRKQFVLKILTYIIFGLFIYLLYLLLSFVYKTFSIII
ncbi:fatty acyl-CoA reductase wat-like [Battus philenor]|uniref:fatty acyl-CoA reductase wat-like n=1 Tax=Battus philenor TaxID=42288 RepID=UPI0035CFD3FF